MTFEQAIALITAHPQGPGAKAVSRPGDIAYLFAASYDPRKPLDERGYMLMGGWKKHGRTSETHSAVLFTGDITATDWEEHHFD